MTSITANLSPAQRRLLNVLHDHHDARGMDALRARNAASIDHDEVVGLALADLVEGLRNDRQVDIPGSNKAGLYIPGVILRLTNAGIAWCNRNPLNRLLRALVAAPRGRFDLRDASAACDDDAVIVGSVSDGYASLHFKGDQRETRFQQPGNGRYEFQHGADFVLLATPKIRTVLGPVVTP